jgi:hypothetical protein
MNGSDILLLVNTGTSLVPSYEPVGTQTNVSWEETTEEIDMSSKTSRAKRVDAGRYGATITLDSLYVPTDAAYQKLVAANRSGTKIMVAREEENVTIETALALITSISGEGPDQDKATISVSLTIDGEWTVVGS